MASRATYPSDGEPLLSVTHASVNDPTPPDDVVLGRSKHNTYAAWWKRRHCGQRVPRWAIASCVGVVLLIVILLIVLGFTVIIPKVINDLLDDSSIEFELVKLSKPGNMSLYLDAKGKIKASALLPAKIRSFPLSLYYRGKVMGKTTMPDITMSVGQDTDFATSSLMEILDLDNFNQFGQDMIHAPSLSWRLSGDTGVEVLGTVYSIKFDKVVEIPALNGLQHVKIEAFDLASSNETNINTRLNVSIHNPSVISLEPIGLLHMDIMYKGSLLARSHTLREVNMSMGANYVLMEGTILPENISLFDEVINNYLRGLPCPVTAVAAKENATNIPLYLPVLSNFTLATVLEGMNRGLILETNFSSMELVPFSDTLALFSANVSIVIDQLLGNRSMLEVNDIRMGVELVYLPPDAIDGKRELVIGYMETDKLIVPTSQKGAVINITIDREYLRIEGEQTTINFLRFIQSFIQRPHLNMKIRGTANVTVTTVVSKIAASGLPVNNSVALPGLANLPNVTVVRFDVPRDGPDGGMVLDIEFIMVNPSFASLFLPSINFGMYYRDTYVGYLNATGIQLNPGSNNYHYSGLVQPAERDLGVASEFFSNYLTSQASFVTVRGMNAGNSTIGWLQKASRGLVFSTLLQGMPEGHQLISGVDLRKLGVHFAADLKDITENITMAASFHSPFAVRQQIKEMAMSVDVLHGGVLIGTVSMPMLPVLDNNGNLTVAFDLAPLSVANVSCFSEFAHALLLSNGTDMELRGKLLSSTVSTSIGDLNITGVPIQAAIDLQGANQFKDSITIDTVELIRGSPKGLTIGFNITVNNPLPNVAMEAGSLSMNMRYQNVVIASASVANFNLALGTSTLSGEGFYATPDGEDAAVANAFMSNFIMGGSSPVSLTNGVTDIPVLAYALGDVNISTALPGNAFPLIQRAVITGVSLFSETMDTAFYTTNPFQADLAATFLNFTVSLSGHDTVIGVLVANLTALDKVIYIPGRSTVKSASLSSHISSFGGALEALWQIILAGGKTTVDIKGEFHLLVFDKPHSTESYGLAVHYEQQNIPTTIFGN